MTKFKNTAAFLLERGLPRGVSVDAVDGVGSFDEFMAALREFYADPGDYLSLGIDTVDAFEANATLGSLRREPLENNRDAAVRQRVCCCR